MRELGRSGSGRYDRQGHSTGSRRSKGRSSAKVKSRPQVKVKVKVGKPPVVAKVKVKVKAKVKRDVRELRDRFSAIVERKAQKDPPPRERSQIEPRRKETQQTLDNDWGEQNSGNDWGQNAWNAWDAEKNTWDAERNARDTEKNTWDVEFHGEKRTDAKQKSRFQEKWREREEKVSSSGYREQELVQPAVLGDNSHRDGVGQVTDEWGKWKRKKLRESCRCFWLAWLMCFAGVAGIIGALVWYLLLLVHAAKFEFEKIPKLPADPAKTKINESFANEVFWLLYGGPIFLCFAPTCILILCNLDKGREIRYKRMSWKQIK